MLKWLSRIVTAISDFFLILRCLNEQTELLWFENEKKNGTEASNLQGIHVLLKENHEPTCKVFIHKAPFKQHKRQ